MRAIRCPEKCLTVSTLSMAMEKNECARTSPLTAIPLSVTYCNATMTNTRQAPSKELGRSRTNRHGLPLDPRPSSAEACREALASSRPMKDSTIRTVLRRLEEKGYLTHETEGRTFIYKASDARQNVAVRAVKGIIDRFCGGSAEATRPRHGRQRRPQPQATRTPRPHEDRRKKGEKP